jgi:hypothetical protein
MMRAGVSMYLAEVVSFRVDGKAHVLKRHDAAALKSAASKC